MGDLLLILALYALVAGLVGALFLYVMYRFGLLERYGLKRAARASNSGGAA